MKSRLLIILIIGALITGACRISGPFGLRTLRGSGNVTSETRPVSDFHRVEFNGAGELRLVQGEQESLEIEAEDNILKEIETRVSGGTLTIGYGDDFRRLNVLPTRPIIFTLTVVDLDTITVNGGAEIRSEAWAGEELAVEVNGGADINLDNVSLDRLVLRLSGGASCRIDGDVSRVEVQVDGAGSIDLEDLKAAQARVVTNGLADIRLWVTDELNVNINGAGQVGYYGDPQVTRQIDGLGTVRQLGEK